MNHQLPHAITLDDLEEEILAKMKQTMHACVIAAREQKGECWDVKEQLEGGIDALYDLARRAGVHDEIIDYNDAQEQASRRLREETETLMVGAAHTVERLQAARNSDGRVLSEEELVNLTEAQEALEYGPHILRYLSEAGEYIEEIA